MSRTITLNTPWGATHQVTVPDGASDQDIASYLDKIGPDMAKADGAKGAFMVDQNGQNKRWIDTQHAAEAMRNGWQTSGPTQLEKDWNAPRTGIGGVIVGGAKKIGQMATGMVQTASALNDAAHGNPIPLAQGAVDTAESIRRANAATPTSHTVSPANPAYHMPMVGGAGTFSDINQNVPERTAMMGGAALGADTPKMAADLRRGDIGGAAVEATPLLVQAVAPEVLRRVGEVAPKVGEFAQAPSDPNAVYASYLKPIADAPVPTPKAPAPVLRAVFRDMEAAGEGDVVSRIKSGNATVADLDSMRQHANRLSKSIFRSPGNYPPGMALGANSLANTIRETIYPLIEKSQGLPEGSLSTIKDLQGQAMEAERNPSIANQIVKKAVGGGIGGAVGTAAGGPVGGAVGAIVGTQIAEPLATAADRGLIGLKTKVAAMNLPEPGLQPRLSLPAPRMMPASEPAPPMANAPAWSPTTRAQRLGLMLPERAGGNLLEYQPEMTPGEQTAATMQKIRQPMPRALPEKSAPVQLGPSSVESGPQGGHAGGQSISLEEGNRVGTKTVNVKGTPTFRSGTNVVISRSGEITNHFKAYDPGSTPSGSAHVTVMPDGRFRVNPEGGTGSLTVTQMNALRGFIKALYSR